MAPTKLATLINGYLCRSGRTPLVYFIPSNIPETVQNSLVKFVIVGIGGYVVDRSCEKIADKFKGPN